MSGAIAIFVKTPGLSPVKTRLAVKLGQKTAETFHSISAQAISEVVQATSQNKNIQGYFAVAEQSALNKACWQSLPSVWQGEGGLGERMAHIYQTLLAKHNFVILVGADIPQITAGYLLDASSWLTLGEQAQMVFGPSDDGGFWLFGGNCNIPEAIWTDVIYSVEDTGMQFLRQIEQIGDIKKMTSLRDLDVFDDLYPLRNTLIDLKAPSPSQRELVDFLDKILPETLISQ